MVLDEPLARLPIGGLRIGGRALSAVRPVVHAARPSDTGCLPALRRGERAVAIAEAATRVELFAAETGELLHVGVRAEAGELGPSLVLHDGRATALELAGRGHAPARVVLAMPGDAEGAYTLAMAFVAAGAGQVIASLGPVSDPDAARVAAVLGRPGAGDPATALARLQAAAALPAAASPEPDWSAFAVFGRATCSPTP